MHTFSETFRFSLRPPPMPVSATGRAQVRLQRAALEAQLEGVRKEWSERQRFLKEELRKRQQDIAERMRAVTSDSKVMSGGGGASPTCPTFFVFVFYVHVFF